MPPAVDVMDSQVRRRKVTIHLSDVDRTEDLPDRIITLAYPNWSVEIGRGSQSDDTIQPRPNNVWYTSKVVSRIHAEITANPMDRIVTVKDKGSMHGTFLNDRRITGQPQGLLPDDILTFGTRVVRGAESFAPLKTVVSFEWSEDTDVAGKNGPTGGSNTFTADYSDADVFSDDEVEVIRESVRQPSVEVLEERPVTQPDAASSSTNTSPRSDKLSNLTPPSPTTTSTHGSVVEEKPNAESGKVADSQAPPNPPCTVDVDDDYDFEYDDDSEDSEADEGSDFDDESDGENPPKHGRPGDVVEAQSAAQSEVLQVPASSESFYKSVRDPSPSDAAMVKPPAIPPSPYPPYPRQMPPSLPIKFGQPMSSSSMFFHSPPASPPAPPLNAGYDFFQPSYPAFQGPFGYDFATNFNYASTSPSTGFQSPQATKYPEFRHSRPLDPSAAFPAATNDLLVGSSTTMAPASDAPSDTRDCSLKRKFDTMSDEDVVGDIYSTYSEDSDDSDDSDDFEAEFEDDLPAPEADSLPACIGSHGHPTASYSKGSSSNPTRVDTQEAEAPALVATEPPVLAKKPAEELENVTMNDLEDINKEAESSQEPPRKKARVEEPTASGKPSTARSFLKNSAIAFVGAAAGAVGTIVALANLPPDYFA